MEFYRLQTQLSQKLAQEEIAIKNLFFSAHSV
jgi:hypothetical protein